MAINNDIYFNAAFTGFYVGGITSGTAVNGSSTATDYAALKDAAVVMATAVDALIAEDAAVTTGGGDASQLAIGAVSDNAYNEQWKASLLKEICQKCVTGRTPINSTTLSAAWAAGSQPARCVAQWTEALLGLTNAA